MDMPNHIPIHPRFASKVFKQSQPGSPPSPQPSKSSQSDDSNHGHGSDPFSNVGGVSQSADDFDLFEVPVEKPKEEETKKKPYDKMIIIMAVVIVVLIAVVIWLMLSSNDESANDKSINPSQLMGYPPGRAPPVPPQYMQMSPQQAAAQQAAIQQQQMAAMQQAAAQQQAAAKSTTPPKPAQSRDESPRVSKSEMDSLYDELKQKSANNEKLPMDKYVKDDSKKQTLETIFEDNDSDENIEEYSTDADDILERNN